MTDPALPDIEVEVYPLHAGQVLDGHHWAPLHYQRLLNSRWHYEAVQPENRASAVFGIILWFQALQQDPAGTLPDDEGELAMLAGLGLASEDWAGVRRFALRKWSPVIIADRDGEVVGRRLAHPFVTGVALEAMGRKASASAARAAGRERTVRSRIRRKLAEMPGLRVNPGEQVIEALCAHFMRHELRVTDANLRTAWHQIVVQEVANGM